MTWTSSLHVINFVCNNKMKPIIQYQFSCSVMSNSLGPHGLQHVRPPCPSPSPRVCPSSCPLNRWCHLIISFSALSSPFVVSLSQHRGLFQWVSSSHQVAKVLELQFQHQTFQWGFRVDFQKAFRVDSLRISWFDLAFQGTLKSLLQHHNLKASILWWSAFFMVQLSHLYMITGKNHIFEYTDFCWQNDVSAF